MIKKLISLTLASLSTLALAGCGESTLQQIDASIMGDGTSNKTGLGGYWWTYVDRSDKSNVSPYTGKVNATDTTETPPTLKDPIAPGNGIDEGAFHVTGKVGIAPYYAATDQYDPYWDAFYGPDGSQAKVCGEDGCKEMKYPAVGIGFGFQANNIPLGAKANGKKGLSFKIRLGANHGKDPQNNDQFYPVNVSLPTDLTDAPDPTFQDQFGTQYANNEAPPNKPLCTFPGSLVDDKEVGSDLKTCFANMTTEGNTTLELSGDWTHFCLAWDRFAPPTWTKGQLADAGLESMDQGKTHLTKVQFDAYKPPYDAKAEEGFAVDFDFYLDDVLLVDEAKWDTVCADAVQPDAPAN